MQKEKLGNRNSHIIINSGVVIIKFVHKIILTDLRNN